MISLVQNSKLKIIKTISLLCLGAVTLIVFFESFKIEPEVQAVCHTEGLQCVSPILDSSVSKVDTNAILQLAAEKKQEEESLKLLISAYRGMKFVPGQVVGDDIVAGAFPDNYPYIRSGRTYGYTAY